MRDHMRTELTSAALMMATQRQRPAVGLICHSDRGSQYAAEAYRKQLADMKATPSMSRTAALIKRAARNRTVLMVEHNLSVVASLSDRITVLARGKVLAEGP